jgi:hypothetical protein
VQSASASTIAKFLNLVSASAEFGECCKPYLAPMQSLCRFLQIIFFNDTWASRLQCKQINCIEEAINYFKTFKNIQTYFIACLQWLSWLFLILSKNNYYIFKDRQIYLKEKRKLEGLEKLKKTIKPIPSQN